MLDPLDQRIIARLCDDIGESREPFAAVARELEISEEELLARIRRYQDDGLMRRLGAILRHQRAGYVANGMSVWQVPVARVAEVGSIIAACPEVSHCYARPALPDWPYNVYAMIHAASEDACHAVAVRIAHATGIREYQVLFSRREFKKTSRVYGG